MRLPKHFKIALIKRNDFLQTNEAVQTYIQSVYERYAILLSEIMKFSFEVLFETSGGTLLPNGSWTGLIGLVNRSEADIALAPFYMTQQRTEAVRFSYPFVVDDLTFVTANPHYAPEMFAVFYPFSLSVWISLVASVAAMFLTYASLFNKKKSFPEIFSEIVSVSLRQPSTIKSSLPSERLLIMSWMVGMLFFSLGYNSVLLSYFSFPPLGGVRCIPELAKVVEDGEYQCMMDTRSSLPLLLSTSDDRSLKIIGNSILRNPQGYGSVQDFLHLPYGTKTALIETREDAQFLKERYFISKDKFFQFMQAMAVKKNFCCRNQLNTAIHRIAASGLYEKALHDYEFLLSLRTIFNHEEETHQQRSLTLVDVFGAFLFLSLGYVISILAMITEIIISKVNETEAIMKERSIVLDVSRTSC